MPVVDLSNTCMRYMPMFRLPVRGSAVMTCGSVIKGPPSSGQHVRTGRRVRSGGSTTSWDVPPRTRRTGLARSLRVMAECLYRTEGDGGIASVRNAISS